MWTRFSCISMALLVLGVFSCKKEDVLLEKEETLVVDTSLFVFGGNYISHTATQLNFQVDMVSFNEKFPELDYLGFSFVDTSFSLDFTTDVSNTSIETQAPTAYSTVIAVDLTAGETLYGDYVGVYLRRFFEITDSLPNRQAAFSTFSDQQNTATRFHSEDPQNIFGNSWQYSNEQYHILTHNQEKFDTQTPTSSFYLKKRLIDMIDTLVASSHASGDLSITLISGWSGYTFAGETDADEIIAHALANNVRINFITPTVSSGMNRVTIESGGFICQNLLGSDYLELENGKQFSPVQNGLLNLDPLLSRNLTTHRCNVVLTQTGTGTWQSGGYYGFELNYNDHRVLLEFKIP